MRRLLAFAAVATLLSSPSAAQNYCPAATLVILEPGVGEAALALPLGISAWDQNARNVSAICRGETTPGGATLPAACSPPALFFDTSATAGLNLYGCTAADTWTLLGGGGAALTVREEGGTPSVANVTEIRVTDGTLTDLGGGAVSLATGGGGGGGAVAITDLRKSASETLTHDVYSELIWQTEIDDVGGYHAANAAAVVIPVGDGGVFRVQCGGLFAANGTGMRFLDLWLNGTFFARTQNHSPPASNSLGLTVERTRRFADGDSITCAAYQDSGGDLSLFSASTSTFFTVVRLGD